MELYNADCYEKIKQIPSKSVDLVYIDIPYSSNSVQTKSKNGVYAHFNNDSTIRNGTRDKTFKEISKFWGGIDYSIFDELCRVLKHIYIYGVAKNKY